MQASHLPAELLIQIFSHLSTNDQLSASKACTYWEAIILKTPSLLATRYKPFINVSGGNEVIAIHNLLLRDPTRERLCCSVQNSKILGYTVSGVIQIPEASEFALTKDVRSSCKDGKYWIMENRTHTPTSHLGGILDEPCFATDDVLNLILSDYPFNKPAEFTRWNVPFVSTNLSPMEGEQYFLMYVSKRSGSYIRSLGYEKVRYIKEKGHRDLSISLRQLAELIVGVVERYFEGWGCDLGKIHLVEIYADTDYPSFNSPVALVYHPDSPTEEENYMDLTWGI